MAQILGFVFAAASTVIALAMLLLVVWQAPRHRHNRLMAVYLATLSSGARAASWPARAPHTSVEPLDWELHPRKIEATKAVVARPTPTHRRCAVAPPATKLPQERALAQIAGVRQQRIV